MDSASLSHDPILSDLKCNLESLKGVRAEWIIGEIITEMFKKTWWKL